MSEQLVLDLGHRPALGVDDFLLAPCNADAVAWLDRWPEWPAPALTLHGPAGCGKTHLAQVWRTRSAARVLPAAALADTPPDRLAAESGRWIVEDAGPGLDERALLHLYNMIAERGGHLLICARAAPIHWHIDLADLRSRLVAAPAVAVGSPDDGLIGAVLVKLFADRQLRVGDDVLTFLLARMERSFASARALVAALDRSALAAQRRITVPLARDVLAKLENGNLEHDNRGE